MLIFKQPNTDASNIEFHGGVNIKQITVMIVWAMPYWKINQEKQQNRIKSTIAATKNRADFLYKTLQPMLDNNPDLNVKYHSNCASKYCLVKHRSQNQDPPSKQLSGQSKFNFQKLCVCCGIDCYIIPEAYIVLTLHHFCPTRNKLIDQTTYLEDLCEKCIDKWGQDVKLQLAGIPNILVSGDRYHKYCKKDFFLLIKMRKTNLKKIILFCLTWY